MTLRVPYIGLVSFLGLAACIGGGSKPPAYLFDLQATQQRPASADRTAKSTEIIAVAVPAVPRMLATTRVPVINSAQGVAYLQKGQWVDMPASLFQQVLVETVGARSGRVALPLRQAGGGAALRLNGSLTMFGLDAATGEAVIIYDAVLTGRADGQVLTRRFQYRAGAPLSQPQAAVRILQTGANDVAAQVADWLAGS